MERIKRRTVGSYTLTASARDEDGDPVDITGTPTLTIYDGTGTAVFTDDATISDGDLSASWVAEVAGNAEEWRTPFELVGGFIFEIGELRDHDEQFENQTNYPTEQLKRARTWAEDRFEHPLAACAAYVPRGCRETRKGNGTPLLYLTYPNIRRVISVTVDGTALTEAELSELTIWRRAIESPSSWMEGSKIEVFYEHGYDVPPEPVKEAVMILAKEYAVESALSSRATSESTDVGFLRLSIATAGGRTGIPEVDAVMADYGHRLPAIG